MVFTNLLLVNITVSLAEYSGCGSLQSNKFKKNFNYRTSMKLFLADTDLSLIPQM